VARLTVSYKYVDLSGYGFSGKHAVIDLLREFRGYNVPHFAFEFLPLRIQGGILDLEDALVNDWSPIRSDAAIRRFKRLVRRLAAKNSLRHPISLFEAVGWNYDSIYAGRFTELSDRFVQHLVAASWVTDWPYPNGELSGPELFVRKLLFRLGVRTAMDFRVHLSLPDDFVGLAREYLGAVLSSNVPPGTTTIVMHNAFEPFQPQRCLKYFDRVRCIIVDRDPRDTYVQHLKQRSVAIGPLEFVRRFRMFRAAARRFHVEDPAILRIQFEQLIFNYDEIVGRILHHLGEPADAHERPREHFDPAVSRRNVGAWLTYEKPEEIEYIRSELSEYCFHPPGPP
jgi:hypothetical protein